jgi:hypothetical protein
MNWQPIETAPKDADFILLYGKVRRAAPELSLPFPVQIVGYWDEIDEDWCCITSGINGPYVTATHWMPLPEPPK